MWMFFIIHHIRIYLKLTVITASHCLLEGDYDLGAVEMILLVVSASQTMEADGIKSFINGESQGIKCLVMPVCNILLDLLDTDTAHVAYSSGKVTVYEFL